MPRADSGDGLRCQWPHVPVAPPDKLQLVPCHVLPSTGNAARLMSHEPWPLGTPALPRGPRTSVVCSGGGLSEKAERSPVIGNFR